MSYSPSKGQAYTGIAFGIRSYLVVVLIDDFGNLRVFGFCVCRFVSVVSLMILELSETYGFWVICVGGIIIIVISILCCIKKWPIWCLC